MFMMIPGGISVEQLERPFQLIFLYLVGAAAAGIVMTMATFVGIGLYALHLHRRRHST